MSAENLTPKQDVSPSESLFQRIKKGLHSKFAAGVFVLGLGTTPVVAPMNYDATKLDPQKTSQQTTSPEVARATATPTPTPTEQTSNSSSPEITVDDFQAKPTPSPTPEGGPTLTAQQQLLKDRGQEIADGAPIRFIGSYEMRIGDEKVSAVAYKIQHYQGRLRLTGNDPRGALVDDKGNVVLELTADDEVNLATLDSSVVKQLAVVGDGEVSYSRGSQSLESEPTGTPELIVTPTSTSRAETPAATATPRPTATASELDSTPLEEESLPEIISSTTTIDMTRRPTTTATPGSETADSKPPAQQTREAEIVAAMQEKVGTRFVGPIELTVDGVLDELPHYELTKDEGTIAASGETLQKILLLNNKGEVVAEIPASRGSATFKIDKLAREITGFAVQTEGKGDQHAVAYDAVIPGSADSQP